MNDRPEYTLERTKGGYVASIRKPHKAVHMPIMAGDEPRVFPNVPAALAAVIDAIVGIGWSRINGTADGIPKPSPATQTERMFRKGDE